MITVEEAKQTLSKGTSVFYKGIEFLRISALIFKKSSGKFSCYAELLDKNNNCVISVPLEFLEKEDLRDKKIYSTGYEDILENLEETKDLSCLLFNKLDSGKLEDSQNQLHYLMESLLKLDDLILKEIKNQEKNL